jgi:uncharacterized protein (DUF2147 family)
MQNCRWGRNFAPRCLPDREKALAFQGSNGRTSARFTALYSRQSALYLAGRLLLLRPSHSARGDVVWLETNISAARRAALAVAAGLLMILPTMITPAPAAPVALSSLMGSPAQGTWRTQNGTEITVAPCPQGFCGTISWVVVPKANAQLCRQTDHTAFASLMLDYSNPDKALQTRPILGLNMLTLTPTSDPNNFTAKVYNPQDGSTNDVQIFIINGGSTLRIGGACIANICAVTQDWPKVPDRPDAPGFTCDGGQ